MGAVEFRHRQSLSVVISISQTEDISEETVDSGEQQGRIGIKDPECLYRGSVVAEIKRDESHGRRLRVYESSNGLLNISEVEFGLLEAPLKLLSIHWIEAWFPQIRRVSRIPRIRHSADC